MIFLVDQRTRKRKNIQWSRQHLCFDLNFPPEVETNLRANLWSYDFDGDFKAFFTAVEARPEFELKPKAGPVSAAVSLAQV